MRILLLAPHPFYQERGTPIAVDLLLKVLSERGDQVDVLTFHEGDDKHYDNVTIHRINPWPAIKGIAPGFSVKKLYCDFVLWLKMMVLLKRNQYDLIHAVEESATLAMFCKPFSKVPYVYDMDSVITEQLLEKSQKFKLVVPLVRFFEAKTIYYSQAVVAVCQAIADYAHKYKSNDVHLLKDVCMIEEVNESNSIVDLKTLVNETQKIGLYIGNLETYQGIDLLLEAMQVYSQREQDACFIIIGGKPQDVSRYTEQVAAQGLSDYVKFLGPKPIQDMGAYLSQADFLLSPRIKGINTPMKVYSYLGSGVPLLATALPTHTQVFTDDVAYLAQPDADSFAAQMQALMADPNEALQRASKAKAFIEREHSIAVFGRKVNEIYDTIATQLKKG